MKTDEATETARMVLAKCAAYDPWFPQPIDATVYAWAEQIALMNLTREDLLAGVTESYRTRGDGFKPLPADIISAARTIRQDRAMRQPLALPPPDGFSEGRIKALLAASNIGHHNQPPPTPGPKQIRCPHCGAQPGRGCTVRGSTDPLTHPPYYHNTRMQAAAGITVDPPPTPPPAPPRPTVGAACPICEHELVTEHEAGRGVCDSCWPGLNGNGQPSDQSNTA